MRRQHTILQPNMNLESYTKPLVSASFQWITFFTLSNVTISRRDLINMSNLVNLGALAIGSGVLTPDVGLEDGVVRAWSRAAADAEAFSLLRVLNLRNQKDVTARVFQYLHDFPSLSIVGLDGCSIGIKNKQIAMSFGWRYKTGKMLNEHLPDSGKGDATWDSLTHACFRAGGAYSVETVTAEGVEAVNALPMLHFTLGAATSDAELNASGNYKLQCFERVADWTPPVSNLEEKKRPIDAVDKSKGLSRKKPVLRASKQQTMSDLLMGLGT